MFHEFLCHIALKRKQNVEDVDQPSFKKYNKEVKQAGIIFFTPSPYGVACVNEDEKCRPVSFFNSTRHSSCCSDKSER